MSREVAPDGGVVLLPENDPVCALDPHPMRLRPMRMLDVVCRPRHAHAGLPCYPLRTER